MKTLVITHKHILIAGLPFLLAAALAAGAEAWPRSGDDEAMQRMADEAGCSTCHEEGPVAGGAKAARALAPSWREIATKYRGRAGAEKKLAQAVVGGTDPEARHWKNRSDFAGMLPNEVAVTADQARSLVRWILRRFGSDRAWRGEADANARSAQGERMRHFAGEQGCTVCHREAPSPRGSVDAAPLAPSWREIARRYRGDADAETRLTRVIMHGTGPSQRHWKDRLEFNSMQGNEARVSPGDARALARWILSSP